MRECRLSSRVRSIAAGATIGLVGVVSVAQAAERTCSGDPVADTANVLCAPPSGPCSATEVTLGGNIEVRTGSCKFDLGGRSLRVTKTFQMIGSGSLVFEEASAIVVTSTGKLKARGDFVLSDGEIMPGGLIRLLSAGDIKIAGRLETSGDGAGPIEIVAGGAVHLQSGAVVQANGISTFVEEGDRFADGGDLTMFSASGTVTIDGEIFLNGQNHGAGGALHVRARGDVFVNQALEVTGGAGGGGDVNITAGDNVVISRPVDVDSRSGGGEGGTIAIEAGDETLAGDLPGGSILIDNTRLELNGSPPEGDGGELDLSADTAVQVLGANAALRANAGTSSSGRGGTVSARSGSGDLVVQGQILAQGGSAGGEAGRLVLSAERDLVFAAASTLTSRSRGGVVEVSAGRDVTISAPVNVRALIAAGTGGSVSATAGLIENGTLRVTRDIDASGGASNGRRQAIALTGCTLIVESGVRIDGHAGTAPNGALGGAITTLAARHHIHLRGNSQYLANPGGRIVVEHPPAMTPTVDVGVQFNPPRRDDTSSPRPLPNCGTQP